MYVRPNQPNLRQNYIIKPITRNRFVIVITTEDKFFYAVNERHTKTQKILCFL